MPEKNELQGLLPFTERLEVTANKVKRMMFKGGDKTGYAPLTWSVSPIPTQIHVHGILRYEFVFIPSPLSYSCFYTSINHLHLFSFCFHGAYCVTIKTLIKWWLTGCSYLLWSSGSIQGREARWKSALAGTYNSWTIHTSPWTRPQRQRIMT